MHSSQTAMMANSASVAKTPPERKRLYITHVDSLGPYIKISGLLNVDALGVVRRRVQKLLPTCYAIDPTWPVTRQQALLLPDAWCIYKRINGTASADIEFVRARIIKVIASTTPQAPPKAEIDITDYGCTVTVNSFELLFPQQPEQLQNLPTMCSQYIVLGICEDWSRAQLDEISRMIAHHTLDISIVKEFKQFKFITMKWKDFNFDEYLILHKNLGAPISIDLLFNNFEKTLREYEKKQPQPYQQDHQQQQQQQFTALPANSHNNNMNSNTSSNTNTFNNNYSSQRNNYNQPTMTVINGSGGGGGGTGAGIGIDGGHNMGRGEIVNHLPPSTLFNNHINEVRAAPSLSARLQYLQHPQTYQAATHTSSTHQLNGINNISNGHNHLNNVVMYEVQHQPVQPRVPQSIGNLRSMIPGIYVTNQRPLYNNSVSYHHAQPPPVISSGYEPNNTIMSPHIGSNYQPMYNTRYPKLQHIPPMYQQPPLATTTFPSNTNNVTSTNHHGMIGTVVPAQRQQQQQHKQQRLTPATFKSNSLTVGQMYEVSVSFVENGPFLFSVQLVAAQEELTVMMNRLENVTLQQFTEKPMLGTACIARYSEDGQLYRALITGVQPLACKVAYIDYGNAEIVKYHDLYEIPDEFLSHKAFAIRFTLSGHKELEPIDESLKKAFKDLVLYKNCKLKVMPLEGPPLVQYCELYLQQESKSALEILKQIQKKRLVYAKAEPLRNNDIVEIRYIDSPRHFYVQKVQNIPAFEQLMDDMFLYYNKNQMVPNHLALGAPCIVKYDNEWYRAEVMRADASVIMVRHVDFGYEQKVTKNLLSTISEQHLKLPRQAVQCCLKGFENNELNKDLATTQFEMLAEETNRQRRSFTVKVFRLQPDGVNLVNLCTKDLNVMKKLYKLSMPFEQYLSFEKEDFNMSPYKQKATTTATTDDKQCNGHKAMSTASSSEAIVSNKSTANVKQQNSNAMNQTLQQHFKSPQKLQQLSQPVIKSPPETIVVTVSTDWDKQSSHSSLSTDHLRNSRSSSTEIKNSYHHHQSNAAIQQQQQQNKRYNRNNNNNNNNNINQRNSNTSSGNSVASMGSRSNASSNSYYGGGGGKVMLQQYQQPPRFQQQQQEKRYKQQQQQQQQKLRNQRPQNAPQGFSQKQGVNQKYHHKSSSKSDSGGTSSANSSLCNSPPQKLHQRQQQLSNINNTTINNSVSKENTPPRVTTEQNDTETYMPLTKSFPIQDIDTPSREDVTISWWISPHQFYTQQKSRLAEFDQFMQNVQQFYRDKPLQQLPLKVGSHVMARHRKDNIIYRARVLGCNQMLRKYKVLFVDYGNQYAVTSEDIWQVEQRFANFPIMAHLCGFDGIISNFDHLYIIDCMDKYLPSDAILKCEYLEKASMEDLYYVNIKVNSESLRDILKKEGLITQISPELRLDLLAGQQVHAKIFAIKDMLNFKIELPYCCDNIEHIQLLSSYDDVRFVKSNQMLAKQFKQFYEGKTCVINIKDVNNNKVLLLRPLMPLLKDELSTFICTPPVLLETFIVRIVYVASPYRLFAQMVATEMQMAQLLDDMYNYYENEGTLSHSFEFEQICAAKGSDGNWYRARIISTNISDGCLEVYYIDYGNTERVAKEHVKHLEEKFYRNIDAFGLEINLPVKTLSYDKQQQQKEKENNIPNTDIAHSPPSSSSASSDNDNTDQGSDIKVINYLTEITLDQEMIVKALEMHHNHLMAELLMPDERNIVDLLKSENLIVERNMDCMRKILDKEKPNMLEYIEMVDLTLEDDEAESRKHKTKTSTPKKNKNEHIKTHPTEQMMKLNNERDEIKSNDLIKDKDVVKDNDDNMIKVNLEEKEEESLPSSLVENAALTLNGGVVEETAACTTNSGNSEKEGEEEELVEPFDNMEHAVLAHCDNPAQFFVHPIHKMKDLQLLQENLQIVASSLPPLMRIIKGAYCISMYSVDKQWYRAKILDAELMVLQFIDFGNTDCVSDTSDLKEMLVFPDIPPLCIPCALPIRPNGTADWVDAANAIFNDSYAKILDFKFICDRREQNKKSFISLYIERENITDYLIKRGYAKPLQLAQSGENCYISHVNDINDFYIQYENNSKALELIELYLADYEKLKPLEEFVTKKVVAARFPDDQMWYRAELLKETNDGYEVLFIDYGNTSTSADCREISANDVTQLPPLSQKCSLELPDNCANWSEAAEERFREIAATGETIFSVELREPAADHAIVHLLIDGHNVNDDLEILCEKKHADEQNSNSLYNISLPNSSNDSETNCLNDAIVSHVNSLNDFYVQFTKDTIRLEDMTHSLNTLNMDPLATNNDDDLLQQLYAAKNEDDQTLYRARIIEVLSPNDVNSTRQYRVLFVDYGNESIVTELRTLPLDLMHLKPFAKQCEWELAATYSKYGNKAVEMFNAVLEKEEFLIKVEIIDSNKSVVRLLNSKTQESLGDAFKVLLTEDNATIQLSKAVEMPLHVDSNKCVITHAISPAHFYIQLDSNTSALERINKTLRNVDGMKQLKPLIGAEINTLCIVYSTEDECYYRGRVKSMLNGEEKLYEIFLLDYGNSIMVCDLKEMPSELAAIPELVVRCQLSDIPSGFNDKMMEESFATLMELHFGDIYDVEIVNKNNKSPKEYIVKLQVNYRDLAEELNEALISPTKATDDETLSPQLSDANIIHINSPQSFYVQLTEHVTALKEISERLENAETEFPLHNNDLQIGMKCVAQFPDDSAYYRAEIVDVLGDGKCEVHFLDFGNNSITDQLRQMPNDLLNKERYSKHCSLDATCPLNEQFNEKFAVLIDSHFSETFQIEFLKTSPILNIVRVFYREKNIIQEVQQILKQEESEQHENNVSNYDEEVGRIGDDN